MSEPKLYTWRFRWAESGRYSPAEGIGATEEDAYQNYVRSLSVLEPAKQPIHRYYLRGERGNEVGKDFYEYVRQREAKRKRMERALTVATRKSSWADYHAAIKAGLLTPPEIDDFMNAWLFGTKRA